MESNMKAEREFFEDHYKKIFGDIGFDYLKSDGSYSNDVKNNMWLSWQASAQRQGYKLVPVNYECNWCGCTELDGFKDKAMIGAVDE